MAWYGGRPWRGKALESHTSWRFGGDAPVGMSRRTSHAQCHALPCACMYACMHVREYRGASGFIHASFVRSMGACGPFAPWYTSGKEALAEYPFWAHFGMAWAILAYLGCISGYLVLAEVHLGPSWAQLGLLGPILMAGLGSQFGEI